TSTAPAVVALTASSTSVSVGAQLTLTATVTAVGNTPPVGAVVFYNGGQQVGDPMRLALGQTVNGYSRSRAMLTRVTTLPVGVNQLTARYYGAPAISGVSATQGGSGQVVRINGVNLAGATSVTFNGTAADSFTVDSPYQITAVVAGGATGPVVVTTLGGSATAAATFTYLTTPAPTMTTYSPGAAGPGAALTITGSNFSAATGVTVGGLAVQQFSVSADGTQISAILNSGTSASGPVEVTTPGGVASSAYLSGANRVSPENPDKRSFSIGGGGPNIDDLSVLAGAV